MKVGYVEGLGNIWEIKTDNNKLLSVRLVNNRYPDDRDPYLQLCQKQLREYFEGNRETFSLSYELSGTEFQKKVWKSLETIPYGETTTYLEMAKNIGNPKAIRAVGQAVGNNPIAIILPCHRVIGTSGKLVGYAYGLQVKERLLEFEKDRFDENSRSGKAN